VNAPAWSWPSGRGSSRPGRGASFARRRWRRRAIGRAEHRRVCAPYRGGDPASRRPAAAPRAAPRPFRVRRFPSGSMCVPSRRPCTYARHHRRRPDPGHSHRRGAEPAEPSVSPAVRGFPRPDGPCLPVPPGPQVPGIPAHHRVASVPASGAHAFTSAAAFPPCSSIPVMRVNARSMIGSCGSTVPRGPSPEDPGRRVASAHRMLGRDRRTGRKPRGRPHGSLRLARHFSGQADGCGPARPSPRPAISAMTPKAVGDFEAPHGNEPSASTPAARTGPDLAGNPDPLGGRSVPAWAHLVLVVR
jgi:hypothetical protein